MHGFGFQIDLKLTKFNGSSFFVKSQSAVLNFCHLTSFFILIYCKMRKIFFCQIIMGSPLNSNVSKGRSVRPLRRPKRRGHLNLRPPFPLKYSDVFYGWPQLEKIQKIF